MNYYVKNGIHIVEVPVEDFKIVMCNDFKKSAAKKNYVNAGFFASPSEDGEYFTLPVAHVVCDYDTKSKWVKYYCEERGKFESSTKFKFDASKNPVADNFVGRKLSTLMVSGASATITDTTSLPDGLEYAISGVPVMRDGADVKFDTYVQNQGWEAGSLYGTWHTFVGLKEDGKIIYVMGMRTYSYNMIRSAEAFKKFQKLGMRDVIKLDGGGSFIMNVDGKVVKSTSENRRINTIITFNGNSGNPYRVPNVTLTKGNTYKEFNRWLQWQLSSLGYHCDIDGSFGPSTHKQVLAFQRDHDLVPDGSVGPATRAKLLAV